MQIAQNFLNIGVLGYEPQEPRPDNNVDIAAIMAAAQPIINPQPQPEPDNNANIAAIMAAAQPPPVIRPAIQPIAEQNNNDAIISAIMAAQQQQPPIPAARPIVEPNNDDAIIPAIIAGIAAQQQPRPATRPNAQPNNNSALLAAVLATIRNNPIARANDNLDNVNRDANLRPIHVYDPEIDCVGENNEPEIGCVPNV
jgi:hypothetical protein